MTTFEWPKRDKDGRHIGASHDDEEKPSCEKCSDSGYIPDDDSGYANQCDCGAHELL